MTEYSDLNSIISKYLVADKGELSVIQRRLQRVPVVFRDPDVLHDVPEPFDDMYCVAELIEPQSRLGVLAESEHMDIEEEDAITARLVLPYVSITVYGGGFCNEFTKRYGPDDLMLASANTRIIKPDTMTAFCILYPDTAEADRLKKAAARSRGRKRPEFDFNEDRDMQYVEVYLRDGHR